MPSASAATTSSSAWRHSRRSSHLTPIQGEISVVRQETADHRRDHPRLVTLHRPFQRLAIVNRGEAAMRAIRAVRELNWERDEPIRIIALQIEAERHALFVRQADERHCLGEGGYLDYDELERALTETRADAAWVGWGFVAEHPEFAELCERLGIVFVGPAADG